MYYFFLPKQDLWCCESEFIIIEVEFFWNLCCLKCFFLSQPKDTLGVPQCSIHGSLLFTLYVNDYSKCLKYLHATIYADETSEDKSYEVEKSINAIEYKFKKKPDLVNSTQLMKRSTPTMNLNKTQCNKIKVAKM